MREHPLTDHASLDHLSSRAHWSRRYRSDRRLSLAVLELRKHRSRTAPAPDGPRETNSRAVPRAGAKVAR
jgi:hypothetical protein